MDKEVFEQAKKIENNSRIAVEMAETFETYINTADDASIRIEIGGRLVFLNKREPLDKIILDGILNGLYQAKEKYSQMFAEL